MACYDKKYSILYGAITDALYRLNLHDKTSVTRAIAILEIAQREAEEIYIGGREVTADMTSHVPTEY